MDNDSNEGWLFISFEQDGFGAHALVYKPNADTGKVLDVVGPKLLSRLPRQPLFCYVSHLEKKTTLRKIIDAIKSINKDIGASINTRINAELKPIGVYSDGGLIICFGGAGEANKMLMGIH
jgi:hypothetical protein